MSFIAEFSRRTIEHNSPVHVINIDVLDNHEEATLGAFMFCDLAQQVSYLGSKPIMIINRVSYTK